MGKFEHGFGTQLGTILLWRRVPSGSLMFAIWSHQTIATRNKKKIFFLDIQKGHQAPFLDKFKHGFGTQLAMAKGPFWRPDACSLEAPNNSCRKQKKNFFLGIQKGCQILFVGKFEHDFGTQLGAVLHGLIKQTAQLFGSAAGAVALQYAQHTQTQD